MSTLGRQPIISILLVQAVLGLTAAGVVAVWLGKTVAISWALGVAIAVIPNAFLAARLLTPGSESSARALLKAAWLGELGKLLLTAALFAAVFVAVRPLSVLAVLGGYIAAQLAILCLPLIGSGWLDGENRKAKS